MLLLKVINSVMQNMRSTVLNRVLGRTISVSTRVRAHLYTLPLGNPPPPLPGKTAIAIVLPGS